MGNGSILKEIINHSKEEYPLEACGILAGSDNKATKVYKMTNIEKSPVSYFMDSKEQLQVIKDIRRQGLELVGIYHSHPHSPPYPSSKDIELCFYPDAIYVIISLQNLENPEVTAYRINNGNIQKIELEGFFYGNKGNH